MAGTVSDADGNAGPLPTPACPGHRDHTLGVQYPPPKVPPVQHYGALEGAERATYYHRSLFQGVEKKETADGGRGDVGELG